MRKYGIIIQFGLLAVGMVGCSADLDCQSTCNRLYQTEECGIASPGSTQSELLDLCNNSCDAALDIPGEVGDYDPNEYTPASVSIDLENDKQAALWMECVSVTACELLNEGYCAPVW